jgi:hypothetical protein
MGSLPCLGFFLSALKNARLALHLGTKNLIHFIKRTEIVKNFTNFACEVDECAIKFPRSSNGSSSRGGLRASV